MGGELIPQFEKPVQPPHKGPFLTPFLLFPGVKKKLFRGDFFYRKFTPIFSFFKVRQDFKIDFLFP